MKGGASLEDHLAVAREQLGADAVPEEIQPAPPEPLVYVWEWFLQLAAGRQIGMAPNPLAWSDIAAWAALTGIQPSPGEVFLLRRLDAAFMETVRRSNEEQAEGVETGTLK